jgi:hypothetical protein
MSNILASFPMGSGRGVKITNYFHIDKELMEMYLIFPYAFMVHTWKTNDSGFSVISSTDRCLETLGHEI